MGKTPKTLGHKHFIINNLAWPDPSHTRQDCATKQTKNICGVGSILPKSIIPNLKTLSSASTLLGTATTFGLGIFINKDVISQILIIGAWIGILDFVIPDISVAITNKELRLEYMDSEPGDRISALLSFPEDPNLEPRRLPAYLRIASQRQKDVEQDHPQDAFFQNELSRHSILPNWKDHRKKALDSLEKNYFQALAAQSKGLMTDMARISGLTRVRIYELLKKHHLVHKTEHC